LMRRKSASKPMIKLSRYDQQKPPFQISPSRQPERFLHGWCGLGGWSPGNKLGVMSGRNGALGCDITRVQPQLQQTKLIRYRNNRTIIPYRKRKKRMLKLESSKLFTFLETWRFLKDNL